VLAAIVVLLLLLLLFGAVPPPLSQACFYVSIGVGCCVLVLMQGYACAKFLFGF